MNIKVVGAVSLLVLTVLFALQNAAEVKVRLLFWSLSTSLALLVVLLLAIGLTAGWILGSLRARKS